MFLEDDETNVLLSTYLDTSTQEEGSYADIKLYKIK